MRFFGKLLFLILLFYAAVPLAAEDAAFQLFSPAFQEGQTIPEVHTCDGKDISPALKWSAPPRGTQSLMLIMEDPDTAKGLRTHWILFNLPPTIRDLPSGLPAIRTLANSEHHGTSDSKELGYHGPCPPSGNHRYYFKLYAMKEPPLLQPGAARAELFAWMEGRVLAEAVLMGRYQRKPKA
jgi:Raf kinase inhibitor-like YbhB/YbcL family protein